MSFVEYIKESYTELVHKVSWPSRDELAQSAVIVLIASIILALVVWLMEDRKQHGYADICYWAFVLYV